MVVLGEGAGGDVLGYDENRSSIDRGRDVGQDAHASLLMTLNRGGGGGGPKGRFYMA